MARHLGIRSPFHWWEDDPIVQDALKKEIKTLVSYIQPLLNRIAEIVVEHDMETVDIATSAGLVYGVVHDINDSEDFLNEMLSKPIPISPGSVRHMHPTSLPIPMIPGMTSVKNLPPEEKAKMIEAVESLLKELKE